MIVFIFQIDIAHVPDEEGVIKGAGRQIDKGAKSRLHLLAAFEEVTLVAQPHALFRLDALAGLYAKQHLMRVGVRLFDIVDIIGRQQANAKLLGPRHQRLVDRDQLRNLVFLQLNIKIIFAKDIHIPAKAVIRLLLAAMHEQLGYFRAQTAGGTDNALGVFGQKVMIDAGFIVVAV